MRPPVGRAAEREGPTIDVSANEPPPKQPAKAARQSMGARYRAPMGKGERGRGWEQSDRERANDGGGGKGGAPKPPIGRHFRGLESGD